MQIMRLDFILKLPQKEIQVKRGEWWQFCVSFQLEETRGCYAQLRTCVVHITLTEASISPSQPWHAAQLCARLAPGRRQSALTLRLRRLGGHRCCKAGRGKRRSKIPAALAHRRAPCSAALETATAPSSEEACTVPSWHLLGRKGSCRGEKKKLERKKKKRVAKSHQKEVKYLK